MGRTALMLYFFFFGTCYRLIASSYSFASGERPVATTGDAATAEQIPDTRIEPRQNLLQPTRNTTLSSTRTSPLSEKLPDYHIQQAQAHFQSRQQAYLQANKEYIRGLGWLYHHQHILLTATVERRKVVIWNVHPRAANNTTDCSRLTIWVRVDGPEIIAGSAHAVGDDYKAGCHWEFPVSLHTDGEYEVNAKVLLWNGHVEWKEPCRVYANDNLPLQYRRNHFVGFKFYEPETACCEVCSRIQDCIHWSTPPLFVSDATANGCDLYYANADGSVSVSNHRVDRKNAEVPSAPHRRRLSNMNGFLHGPSRNEETAYFLGCGWSFWFSTDFPCLSPIDDHIHMMHSNLTILKSTQHGNKDNLPYCLLHHEALKKTHFSSLGRWTRFPSVTTNDCGPVVFHNTSFGFPITQHRGDLPHCWYREDLSSIGQACFEKGCQTVLSQMWQSSLKHQEGLFHGRWSLDHCQYREFTDSELQRCLDRQQIGSIVTKGESVANFLQAYLDHRLESLNLTKGGREIRLHTFKLPHQLWHSTIDQLEQYFRNLPLVKEDDYWVSGFYYSSEREPHVHAGRSLHVSRKVEEWISHKGYRLLNAYDLTAAFTYDTATQMDGLHIIGPPMKMIVTKLFHHICSKV